MAFLLLLHQKMKLQRKENALTLKQLRFSSLVDRMQKKVQKRQKYYDKLKKQIERQANAYKNQAQMQLSNMMGLGMNSAWDMGNFGAASGAAMQIALGYGANNPQTGKPFVNKDGKAIFKGDDEARRFMQAFMQGGIGQNTSSSDREIDLGNGKKVKVGAGDYYTAEGQIVTPDKYQALTTMQQAAQMQMSQVQAMCNNMKSQIENNVSIWQDYQLEQVEAQEEWEMDMLSEEQTDMESEKESIEIQLKRIQEEKQNLQAAIDAGIKDSAPKFGLA